MSDPPGPPPLPDRASDRLSSLDQFRGYTVLGMFLVNFVSGYREVPRWLHFEHTYCCYHDTIMPQFFLAVGFALRLAYVRRRATDGAVATYGKFVRRGLGLILLGVVVYHLTGRYDAWDRLAADWKDGPATFLLRAIKRGPFEALTHIGLTTLVVLPVLGARQWVRMAYAAGAGALHAGVSAAGYYEWNMAAPPGIDGGPLGFLTWTIPTIAGTLAHDWVVRNPAARTGGAGTMLGWALGLMLLGYGLSCLSRATPPNAPADPSAVTDYLAQPPFVPPADRARAEAERNYWTMSQRAGSVSYLLFATGFGFAVLAAFRVACDGWRLRSGYLGLLGRNALAGYLVHDLVADTVKPYAPRDAPAWYVWAAFAVYLGVTTLFLRYLDKNRYYLRL
jgi:predicted acyltransferase